MNIKLLTEYHLEFLSLKGGYTGSSESTLVQMPHCWKSHVAAYIINNNFHLWVASRYSYSDGEVSVHNPQTKIRKSHSSKDLTIYKVWRIMTEV